MKKKGGLYMSKRTKHQLLLVTFGVILFTLLMNLNSALAFAGQIFSLVSPIVIGLLIAFVLNVPMHGIEKLISRLLSKAKFKGKESIIRVLSLIITIACIALVITGAVVLAVPALSESANTIKPLMTEKAPEWMEWLSSRNIDTSALIDWLEGIDLSRISDNAENVLGSVLGAASSAVSAVISVIFGIVIAVYVLLSKSMLHSQVKKLVYANVPDDKADKIYYVCGLLRETYSKFLSGQCVEAIILGTLIFISFSIFRLPYAGLIGLLTGICSFIPYIGGCCSCLIGMFLILLADPSRIIIAVIVYVIVQFVENQFIYPHVVGNSVGLAPIWTLIAALIGGKLFGLTGIIFFIPLSAVVFVLIRENTYKKLEKKRLAKEYALTETQQNKDQ